MGEEHRLVCRQKPQGADESSPQSQPPLQAKLAGPMACVLFVLLQVARKLVIIESDLERAEERAELSERYAGPVQEAVCGVLQSSD